MLCHFIYFGVILVLLLSTYDTVVCFQHIYCTLSPISVSTHQIIRSLYITHIQPMVQIKVLFFASAREAAGNVASIDEFELPDNADTAVLRCVLACLLFVRRKMRHSFIRYHSFVYLYYTYFAFDAFTEKCWRSSIRNWQVWYWMRII